MKYKCIIRVLALVLMLACAGDALAWGPRTQVSIVNTALHLVTREQNVPLTRLQSDIQAGVSLSNAALEELYPDMLDNLVRAVESEMALLSAVKGVRIDAYFAWRLGALGKLVSRLTAPMADADASLRGQYYRDADGAIQSGTLKPAQRKTIDNMSQLERIALEANSANSLIESEYRTDVGFRGTAAARLANDASRSVNTVADVWWTVITSRAISGNVSDQQLRRYVIKAYEYYIDRGNLGEIEAADRHYGELVSYTPDMRARIGDMLYAGGFAERAVKEYEAVLAAAPERRDVVEKIGAYYMEQAEAALADNLLEEARDKFKMALEANALHSTAEQRRLEVEAMIRRRDEQQERYQVALKQAEDLKALAEEEASRARYAEAIALLQQSEEVFRAVGDEFPMEAQRRSRGLRDTQARLNELKRSLLDNALAFSGTGFGPDMAALLNETIKGLERDAFEALLNQEYEAEIQRLNATLQPLMTVQ